jgi:RNA-binding protein
MIIEVFTHPNFAATAQFVVGNLCGHISPQANLQKKRTRPPQQAKLGILFTRNPPAFPDKPCLRLELRSDQRHLRFIVSLSTAEKKRLRQIGHHLNPVVLLGGNGLTEAVIAEIDARLEDHELIKVRVGGEDRAARLAAIEEIANATKSEVAQIIGKLALLYRAARKPDPKLSNLLRVTG